MDLTPRQSEIMDLVAAGLGDKQIARELGVSPHTVRTHLQRLYRQNGVSNRAEAAAAWATRPPDPPARTSGFKLQPQLFAAAAVVAGLVVWLAAPPVTRALISHPSGAVVAPQQRATSAPSAAAPPAPALESDAGSAQPAAASQPVPTPAAAAPAAPAAPAPQVKVAPPAPPQAIADPGQVSVINADRAAAGLPPLAWNSCLSGVAAQNASRVAAQGYVSSAGGPAADRNCGLGALTAENIAYWATINDSAVNTVVMGNPTQKANLLGPYHYLGAAWATSASGVAYLVQEFS